MKEGLFMKELLFNVYERNEKGKKVRKNGEIPCVIYGEGLDRSVSAKITKRQMITLLGYPKSSVLSLNLNGDIKRCIVKDLQKDSFGKIEHIDFQSIKKGELIKLKIPITFVGQKALESKGFLLETFMSEIELQGDPNNFPAHIEVDISKVEYASQILVENLTIPDGINIDVSEDMVVAKVSSNVREEEETEE